MSIRQMFPGGIVKPGFNPLAAQTSTYFYNLYAWGRNNNGQLGLGNTTDYSSPSQVGSLTNWLQITSQYETLAIKTDGTLWAWGRNNHGQLGLGNRTNYSSPKQVGALTAWSVVSTGYGAFSGAIKTDGTLWTWGRGNSGQLGHGNTTSYSSPKQVGALTTWSKLDCGGNGQILAIKTDGTLWAWGQSNLGQLGLGNTTAISSPAQVGALTNWLKVSAGYYTTLAVKTDGTLWMWGQNFFGNLGLGNRTNYSSPKQVGALTTWSNISGIANGGVSAAIKTDGALWMWGRNDYGQLGLGNDTSYSSPKQVGSLTNWLSIATSYFTVSLKTDGTLWSWGLNTNGQIGDGTQTSRYSPVQVGASTTWSTMSNKHHLSVLALG